MKKAKKVVGAVATVTFFGVFTRIIGFLFKIYLSRSLGAEALGLYQIALSVFFLFASLTSSGVPMIVSRKTAEERAL
ncbi:MAG: oligosaccharide flippase family protein, partial [Clostridia bacterium]|nr:oligosaccharide flippase family protein [Clostridia bacterium]